MLTDRDRVARARHGLDWNVMPPTHRAGVERVAAVGGGAQVDAGELAVDEP